MPFVIRLYGRIGQRVPDDLAQSRGTYLLTADIEYANGRGKCDSTKDRNLAKRFASIAEALEYYRRQSRKKPLMENGEPNRPLTTFSIEIEPL